MTRAKKVRTIVVLVLGLITSYVQSGTALPVGRATETPHALRGTNVIVARGAASTVVSIPTQVRIWHPWLDPDEPAFEIESTSRFVAFALVRLDAGSEWPTMLVGGRLPEDGLSAPFLLGMNIPPEEFTGYYDVPRGRYRLYLVTDARARVTLSLDELDGETRFRAEGPGRYDIEYPKPFPDLGQARNLYSAGATGALHTRGVQMQVYWATDRAHVSSHHAFCWYNGVPPHEQTAYLPPCPLADTQAVVSVTFVSMAEGVSVTAGLRGPRPAGESGQGAWFASAAAIDEVGHVALWLDLD